MTTPRNANSGRPLSKAQRETQVTALAESGVKETPSKPARAKKPAAKNPGKVKRRAALALLFGMATAPLVIGVFSTRRNKEEQRKLPGFVTLDRITSALRDDLRLQLKVAIETTDEGTATTIGYYAPRLRSLMFFAVSTFSAAELRTLKGKESLAKTLLGVFRKNVDTEENAQMIRDVHYLEFLIGE
ncbi:MAG: flagellar basal body-associated FliL family protein [Burkholderiaceae bacterium]|nr:MAG: flagellar basal body-associated FliL family protein [Burkholderiaceae bacterium]